MQTLPGLDLIQDQPWVCEGGSYRAAVSAITNLLNNPELANGQKNLEPIFLQVLDGICYVPIRGILMPRQNLFSSFSDFTTLDILELQIALALGNPEIRAIVLEVDSPGGSVSGIAEMAKFIRGVSVRRPVFALCRQASERRVLVSVRGSICGRDRPDLTVWKHWRDYRDHQP